MTNKPNMTVVHSMLSGKGSPDENKDRIIRLVESVQEPDNRKNLAPVVCTSTREEVSAIITKLITNRVPKIAISGGDGFSALFANCFFEIRDSMGSDDYSPDILFLAGGTGNAISYCTGFKDSGEALKCLLSDDYLTEQLNMLEVTSGGKTELSHFTTFGADGEIIELYKKQKKKGLLGYMWAVLKYAFSRRLYNIFSKNDANYNLKITRDGTEIHSGRHEGGGISAIPYVGYGFKPYPLATKGNSHIRFVLYGAYLMPTMFMLTCWNFLNRKNRFICDHLVDAPSELEFTFDRELHVQVSGDLHEEKQTSVRVTCSRTKTLNLVKCKDA